MNPNKAYQFRYRAKKHSALPHVVKFSGGRSSGMLLFALLENRLLNADRGDVIIFNNTSAEHPDTYRFVRNCMLTARGTESLSFTSSFRPTRTPDRANGPVSRPTGSLTTNPCRRRIARASIGEGRCSKLCFHGRATCRTNSIGSAPSTSSSTSPETSSRIGSHPRRRSRDSVTMATRHGSTPTRPSDATSRTKAAFRRTSS